jgi:hypothetical protein
MRRAKTRHCDYRAFVLEKSQPIAFPLLHLDTHREVRCGQLRPKLAHHRKAAINLLSVVSYSH